MKRALLPALGALILASASLAIVDINQNGVSDLWEKQYNGGGLFPETFDAQSDPDADGWTNAREAAAGTDPFEPNPPDGIIQPRITHVPAVVEEDETGPHVVSPEAVTVTWPTLAGKQYTLLFSPDLTEGSWIPVGDPFVGSGNQVEYGFEISGSDKLFWRVSVTDADTDEDGLTDAEEYASGTNPGSADTDNDGLPDGWEVASGLDPNDNGGINPANGPDGDPDGDGVINSREQRANTDPNNAEDFPVEWITATNRVIGNTNYSNNSYSGSIRYLRWDMAALTDKPLTQMPADIAPSTMETERDTLSLPQTAADALAASSARVARNTLAEAAVSGGSANFYRNPDSHGSSGNYSVARCWLHAPAKPYPRDFHILQHTHHSRTGGAEDFQEVSGSTAMAIRIEANQSWSQPMDIKTTTSLDVGKTNITSVTLVPVDVDDNEPATGVDDVSITASTTDTGYQDKFWIMAPAGNAPDGNACSNLMKFSIPFIPDAELEILPGDQAIATPNPATIVLGAAVANCSWHGESAVSTEAPGIEWKLGSRGQTKIDVDLPIAVKTMKRRTVKMAVYRVQRPGARDFPVLAVEDKAAIKNQLYKIFARQLNAWFEPDHFDLTLSYDSNNDGKLYFESPEETALANASEFSGTNASHDIKVILLDDLQYLTISPTTGEEKPISGHWIEGTNTCIVIYGLRKYAPRTGKWIISVPLADQLGHTMAHEIGHMMLKNGHPDQYSSAHPLTSGGPAPLQSLNQVSDWKKRLMCSGYRSDRKSNLLVKTEWDLAEKWLSTRPNGDN